MEISENSRIWIYQSNREFTPAEEDQIKEALKGFTSEWIAHGNKLAAFSEIRYHRFIVLGVNEAVADATGCSIDKSVRLMKDFESEFGLTLFDRFNIAYLDNDAVRSCSRSEFEELVSNGIITPDTIVFNNMIQTQKDLEINWRVPFKYSWHAKFFARSMAS